MSRRAAWVLGLAVAFALVGSATAFAGYRGTDLWSNIMPASGGQLVNRYPLSAYMLDYHAGPVVSTGGVSSDNAVESVAQFLATWIFFVGVVFIRFVILIFNWAFSVDLLTGPHGALSSASTVAGRYYADFVQPFMVSFIILFGFWLVVVAVKDRRKGDAGSAIVRVIAFSVISMALVTHLPDTVGRAYQMVDSVSQALIARGGDSSTVSDSLWKTFVYRPWVQLEFGGMRHCVNPRQNDSDGYPLATGPGRTLCRDHVRPDAQGHGGYAPLFLGSDSKVREFLMTQIAAGGMGSPNSVQTVGGCVIAGGVPGSNCPASLRNLKIDKADAPAADMMQGGLWPTVQRLVFSIGFVLCMVFGSLLLGLVAVAALFSQIAIVAMSIFAAFTILAALFPPLHDHYKNFLSLLGKVLIGKGTFALLLAILLATSSALMVIFGQQFAIGLAVQALLYGGVFVKRKVLIAKVTSSKTARRYTESEDKTKATVAGAAVASLGAISGGVGEFAQTMRQGWSMGHGDHSDGGAQPDSSSPPASAGREYSPPGDPAPAEAPVPNPSTSVASMDGQGQEVNMRSFRDDLQTERAEREGFVGAYAASAPDQPAEREPLYFDRGRPDTGPARFADDLELQRQRSRQRERDLEPEL